MAGMRAPMFVRGGEDWGSSDDDAFSQEEDLDEVAAVKMVSVYDGTDLTDHMRKNQVRSKARRQSFERDLSQVANAIARQLHGEGASTHGTDRDTVSLGTEYGTARSKGEEDKGAEEREGEEERPSTSAAAVVTPAARVSGHGAVPPSRGIFATPTWGEDALAAIDAVLAADKGSKGRKTSKGKAKTPKAKRGGGVDVDAFLKGRQQARLRGELVQPSPGVEHASSPRATPAEPSRGVAPSSVARRVSPRRRGVRTTQIVALADPASPPRPVRATPTAATVSVVPESLDPARGAPFSSEGASRRLERGRSSAARNSLGERPHVDTLHPQVLDFDEEEDVDEPYHGGSDGGGGGGGGDDDTDPFHAAPDAADYSQRQRSGGPSQRTARRRSHAGNNGPTIGGQSLSQSLGAAIARGPVAAAPPLSVKRVETSQRAPAVPAPVPPSRAEVAGVVSPRRVSRRMSTAGTQTAAGASVVPAAAAPSPGAVEASVSTLPDLSWPVPGVATAQKKRRKSGTTLQEQMRKLADEDARRATFRPYAGVRVPSPSFSLPSASAGPSPGAVVGHKNYAGSLQTGSVAGSGPVSWAAVPTSQNGDRATPGQILQKLKALVSLDKHRREQIDMHGPRCLAGDADKAPIDLLLVSGEAEVHMHKFLCHVQADSRQEVILMLPSKRKESLDLRQGCTLRIFHPWTEACLAGRRTIVSPLACEVLP